MTPGELRHKCLKLVQPMTRRTRSSRWRRDFECLPRRGLSLNLGPLPRLFPKWPGHGITENLVCRVGGSIRDIVMPPLGSRR